MRASKSQRQAYLKIAERHRPKTPWLRNALVAFVVGGLICAVGQVVFAFFVSRGFPVEQAGTPTAAVMIVLGALLTGLGIYDRLGAFAGMGAALPITGFANSIVAPAMEYKREGYVLGVAARMFTVAGPVIVYGVVVSLVMAALKLLLSG